MQTLRSAPIDVHDFCFYPLPEGGYVVAETIQTKPFLVAWGDVVLEPLIYDDKGDKIRYAMINHVRFNKTLFSLVGERFDSIDEAIAAAMKHQP